MNIDAYLDRINYHGSRAVSAATLRDLHIAHLRAVPFENLSIHAGEAIILNDDALFTKIVENRRGGFCYELNGLFAALLRSLGFQVQMLAAGVAKKPTPGSTTIEFGPIFDHMTLMVSLEEPWLADVGFGDSFLKPLRLDERREQNEGSQAYRIVENHGQFILMRRNGDDEWKAQYLFKLDPYNYSDYEGMCRFHQTSPDSHFTKGRVCSLATDHGRITLSDMRLIKTIGSIREEQTLTDQAEYDAMLRDNFGIVM